MTRIKIDLPDSFLFETELTVRIYDLNYGAHVGNDRILSFMHEARVQFFRSIGIENEKNGLDGLGIIMVDAAVVYKSEAFINDHLTLYVTIRDVEKYSFDIVYLVKNSKKGKEVARGKTAIACFDYEKRKITAVPSGFREKFNL